jgi:chloride channel 3/4/5
MGQWLTRTGAAIGMNAAFLNIITEWLSDIKRGHCGTAFYLNENFCCWGEDNGITFEVYWHCFANKLQVARIGTPGHPFP